MGLQIAKVKLLAGGKIDCQPPSLQAWREDDVEWECASGQAFTVDFGQKTPFPQHSYPAKKGKKAKASIPSTAAPGTYKYLVAVYDDSSGEVLTLDPELIIRR